MVPPPPPEHCAAHLGSRSCRGAGSLASAPGNAWHVPFDDGSELGGSAASSQVARAAAVLAGQPAGHAAQAQKSLCYCRLLVAATSICKSIARMWLRREWVCMARGMAAGQRSSGGEGAALCKGRTRKKAGCAAGGSGIRVHVRQPERGAQQVCQAVPKLHAEGGRCLLRPLDGGADGPVAPQLCGAGH